MRKILLLVVLLFLSLTIMEISSTFGLFETNNVITVDNNIAKWQIKVNNSLAKDSVHFTVNNYNIDSDSNVKEGLIAPGVGAYFDIDIDPNNTSVSIRYDITFDLTGLENDKIKIVNIEELGGNTLVNNNDTYAGIIPINNSSIHHIRVYIEWENDEENNEIDSKFGVTGEKEINIATNIKFSQYLGETITNN